MKRLALYLFAFAASPLLAAPVPKELKAETFAGTWKVVTIAAYGDEESCLSDQHWTIDEQANLRQHVGRKLPAGLAPQVRLTIDPKSRSLEYKYTGGDASFPGLYSFDGDTLKVCYKLTGDAKRPSEVMAGRDVYLWTLKRVKTEDKK